MAERIYMTRTELERLRALVEQHSEGRDGAAAERLGAELDRAIVADPAHLRPDVVTVGSRVTFEDARSGVRREVTVVYPSGADASAGRISVLEPIGAALIGQRQGDELEWPLPDRRLATIRILSVSQPLVPETETAA
jgi:regulator of nucleoside diphosphate kinase